MYVLIVAKSLGKNKSKLKGDNKMDVTTCKPAPPKTEWTEDSSGFMSKEVLGKKSFFRYCPNTHLHGLNRLTKIITYQRGPWGRTQRIGVLSFYCEKCGLRTWDEYY